MARRRRKTRRGRRRRSRKRWIQHAIKRPGRVRRYMMRKYGSEAFTKDGEIKQSYINKAIKEIKSRPKSKRNTSLLRALYLARRLETMRKGK